MTEARLRIEKLKLRLRGLDEATAHSLAGGLGEAIAAAVDVAALRGGARGRVQRLDLGSLTASPGASADALRGQVAAAVGNAVSKPASPPSGGAA